MFAFSLELILSYFESFPSIFNNAEEAPAPEHLTSPRQNTRRKNICILFHDIEFSIQIQYTEYSMLVTIVTCEVSGFSN